MLQLNTDCTHIVMPDPKLGLSQQILFDLVALAFCICSFITAFAEHFFRQRWIRGLQELSLLKVQKSLAGWHVALLLHISGGLPFRGSWQNSLAQHRVCQLDSLWRSSLLTFTSPDGVPGLFYRQRSTSRPGSHSLCVSGHQKLSCLWTGWGQSESRTGREATCSQQGFPESHRAAAWPPAPRFEPHMLPGWRQVGAQPDESLSVRGSLSPLSGQQSWAGCRGPVAWCCPVPAWC